MYCFTLLQNSIDLNQFNENLSDIYTIFNSKFSNASFELSLKNLRECIINRKLDQFSNSPKTLSFNKEQFYNDKMKVKEVEIFSFLIKDNNRRDSPFTKYFASKITVYKENVVKNSVNNEKMKLQVNLLYIPAIFTIIENFLHILPLWSGLLITSDLSNLNFEVVTRITNTFVEIWFENLRNKILKISKKDKTKNRLMPSQLISTEFNYIKLTYEQFYSTFIANELERASKKILKKKQKLISEETEKWSYTKKNSDFHREKGIYLQNVHNLGLNDKMIEKEIYKIPASDFQHLFNLG
jgi:hypothetical protein